MAKPLKVMHVIASLEGGGVERLLVKSLAVLDHTSFSHKVCCISGGGVYEEDLRSLGIPYWILRRRFRLDPAVIPQLTRLMRRQCIDVVHTLNFTANAWGRVSARLAGVKRIIAHERGTAWTENTVMRLADRLLYRFTDLVLANSEAAKIMLTERIGLPADRIRVVYNGMPEPTKNDRKGPALRKRLGIGPEVPVVGSVGRLDTPKGHSFLLRSVSRVWQSVPETHFVVIGDGPLRQHLEMEAHCLGLLDPGKMHFLGFLPDAVDSMLEMDLLVHPAIRESLGNVLIEASLARLPAIASNVDGCPEVVIDGDTGLIVDCSLPADYINMPGASALPTVVVDGRTRKLRPPLGPSPEVLAEAIVRLLRDPQLRRRMGERAYSRARRLFGLERYAQDLENAYRGMQ